MLSDWGHVDFQDIERQTEWTCPEGVELMHQGMRSTVPCAQLGVVSIKT